MAPFIKHFCDCFQVIDETLDVKEMIFNAERVGGLVDEPVRMWLPSLAENRQIPKAGFCFLCALSLPAPLFSSLQDNDNSLRDDFSFSSSALIGLLVIAVAIATVIVISLVMLRKRQYGTISHGIVEVRTPAP